jgi:general secretion pathway protein G
MTLVEIMIVVIIMALIATAVGVAVLPRLQKAKEESTRSDAQAVRSAITLFLAENSSGGCPSVDDLVEGGYLDASRRTTDGWDQPFKIECDGAQFSIISGGADTQIGTEDDLQL